MLKAILLCFFWTSTALAQSIPGIPEGVSSTDDSSGPLKAVVTGPTDIAVGRTLVLDASASRIEGENTEYRWYVGQDRTPISRTVEAVYTPEKAGVLIFRLRMTLIREGEEYTSEAIHAVIAYNRKIVLIADASVPAEKLGLHQRSAQEAGVFLRVLQLPVSAPLGQEEAIVTQLSEQGDALVGAEVLVLWTDGIAGLQAVMRTVKGNQELQGALAKQSIVLITNRGLQTLARTSRGPFSVLKPRQIIVTRKEALNPLLLAPNVTGFLQDIEARDIDTLVIDESTVRLRPWNLLTSLVNVMLTHGVSSQTIIFLLMLPVIAMILTFLKQVIGITTFGLYTPSIVALSFLALGPLIGMVFLLLIIVTGYATRSFMRRWRLLYIPKVAIILSVVSVTLLLLLALGAVLGVTLPRDAIFILLIMSTLAESFLNLKTEEGWWSAVVGIGETILAALLCVWIVQWSAFQSLILGYPELILLTFVVNIFLGQWTGLRLVEYFRFREVFKHLQEE
ncbi:hypothetical protein HYZ98_05095 [Candidatus Peregrinibacteria bacterium]|nr:hypothetical protein [Candidatus Peregrinibacteria bacterium]